MQNLPENLKKHDDVVLILEEFPKMEIKACFRGRTKSAEMCYFDREGSGAWFTTDKGIELFTEIEDIKSISVLER